MILSIQLAGTRALNADPQGDLPHWAHVRGRPDSGRCFGALAFVHMVACIGRRGARAIDVGGGGATGRLAASCRVVAAPITLGAGAQRNGVADNGRARGVLSIDF